MFPQLLNLILKNTFRELEYKNKKREHVIINNLQILFSLKSGEYGIRTRDLLTASQTR